MDEVPRVRVRLATGAVRFLVAKVHGTAERAVASWPDYFLPANLMPKITSPTVSAMREPSTIQLAMAGSSAYRLRSAAHPKSCVASCRVHFCCLHFRD